MSDVLPRSRRRTRRRAPRRSVTGVVVGVVVLGVGAAATAGVVTVLRSLDDAAEPVRCAAELDGTSWYLTPEQAGNAALVVGTSVQRGLPARAGTIGIATALQESRLVNIDHGDRDSLGLFQQRPSQGWGTPEQIMDPVYSTGAFYDGLVEVEGYEGLEVTVAAQAVQRSGFPDAYAQHETRARAWASALTGHSPGALTCTLPQAADDDPSGAAGAVELTELLMRDLGLPQGMTAQVEADATSSAVVVDATALPFDDAGRSGWAVAHWAVATASATGAVEVRAGDRVWTREEGAWSALPDGEDARPAGQVTVRLNSPEQPG
ncbi:hypothetical protein [Isoptericola hypogeus]|uniref:hypothetical protein n=1 Tax=Isoptericola hypogeus TaxID=300179 RepID=UPI0031DBD884